MPGNEMKMVIKILGLIGAIFVLIAQFVPWAGGLYLFGADFGSFIGWDFFYINIMSSGAWQGIFLGIMMIIIFFLNLILIINSFLKFKKFDVLGPQIFLNLGIFATVEFIIYIVAVNVVSSGYTGFGAYGIGFIIILLAMIMFYVAFGIGKSLGMVPAPRTYRQPMYQQPTYTQTTQYPQQPQQPPPPAQTPPPPPPPPQPQTQQPAKPAQKTKAVKKFCPNCGTQLTPNAKFCSGCGKEV